MGNKKHFGKLNNGSGYVTQFDSENGNPAHEGYYKNGNKEGWWKIYHYTGYIIDSTFYKNGFDQTQYQKNALNELLDLMYSGKNNFYD